MRRCMIGRYAIAVALLLALATTSPLNAAAPIPDGFTTVQLFQGVYNNTPAWYFATTTNDIRVAETQGLTLSPRLTLALNNVPLVYIVTNFQQGPVFSASPTGGPIDYAGVWRVSYITWLPGTSPRPITNALPASVVNPGGIPTSGINQSLTGIVVDYPILILGSLGNPAYKIPQLVSVDYGAKTAVLPFFNIYCTDFITKRVSVAKSVFTDAEYAPVAAAVKANFAPGLHVIPNSAAQITWLFTPYPFPGWAMNPPSQWPIAEQCPTALSAANTNPQYSPISNIYFLDRTGASPSAVFTNPTVVEMCVASGMLTQTPVTTVNGAIIALN